MYVCFVLQRVRSATPQPFLAFLVLHGRLWADPEYRGGSGLTYVGQIVPKWSFAKERSALFFLEQGEPEADGELPGVEHAKDCA